MASLEAPSSRDRRLSESFAKVLSAKQVGAIGRAQGELLRFAASDTVAQAVDALARRNVLSAPVFRGDACLGLIDWNDLAHFAVDVLEDHAPGANALPDAGEAKKADEAFFTRKIEDLVDYSNRNPFRPLLKTTSLLDAVRELGTGVHRVPLKESEDGPVVSVVSQSDIVHLLERNIKVLGAIGDATVADLGLNKGDVVSVPASGLAIDAFRLMHKHHVGSVAVVEDNRLVGAVTCSDLQGIVENHSISVLFTPVPKFISLVRMMSVDDKVPTIDCKISSSFHLVILKLAATRVHRLFVVDDANCCAGIITLTDVLKVLTSSILAGDVQA